MRIDCYKAREWRWVDSQFTFYCRQTWHSPQETGASPKQALPILLNFSTGQKRQKKGNDKTFLFHDWNCMNYHLKASRQETAKGVIEDCTIETTPCSKKKRRLFIKRVIFIPRYQCSICSLFRIFFRATMQAQTYLKIGVLASHWTKICPSLFECAENTFFHIFVIFKL